MRQTIARLFRTDLGVLILLAVVFVTLHVATSRPYGFHRDELATLDDARHLEWGFVAYPPLTPAMGRLGLSLFGISTVGARLFPILALAVVVVLSGLLARELGGSRKAQVLTALAVAIVPIVTIQTSVLQYVSFDYLWCVLLTYLLLRLLNSGDINSDALNENDPRWWFAIGAVIGLGMMTKYTMAFFTAGLVGGLLLTGAFEKRIRRHLLSPWLWAGVAVSLLIFLPNLIWQIRHSFISLDFLRHIHARDVRWGRTRGFFPEQLFVCVNTLVVPLVFMGLVFYFTERGRKYRLLGWMFVLTFAMFALAQARSFYPGPLYPMLLAAGSVVWERWVTVRPRTPSLAIQGVTWLLVASGAVASFALFTPVAPINSGLWNATAKIHENFTEEIGWTDLVATVARVYKSVPSSERVGTGILVGNYGEAGAINLYGPQYGLPPAISKTNSAWYRSYPSTEPQRLIVLGLDDDYLKEHFEHCDLVAHNTNPYGVINEESRDHPDIYLCHHLLQPWPEFWRDSLWFG
ncbi:MAG: glycosyltransferase family 39 protein [Acidobacteriia bacterium]|nr:glycosyltransferase family 39 protein [Terriglobia bacterium]